MSETQQAYKDAGVDIEAGAAAVEGIRAAVQSTYTPEVVGDIGGFGGLFSAAALKDMDDPLLVSGTDGVGTKLELARRAGRFDTVGIDLVAMCANDIVCCGARPLFFLDYIAVGKLDPPVVAQVVEGIAAGCREAGCALIGGEMAEHPGVMTAGDFDLSGFCVGAVDRPRMLGPELVRPGDHILGLASSGFHSNGYSLVRHALTNALSDEELLVAVLPGGAAQAGGAPAGTPDSAPGSLIDALLAPTRLYVQPLLSALDVGLPVHAAAHITGGGITHNLDRALPLGYDAEIQLGSWPIPPVIQHLMQVAKLELPDALRTFNMGIGMAIIVAQDTADMVSRHFRRFGEVFEIGQVVRGDGPTSPGKVVYRDDRGGTDLLSVPDKRSVPLSNREPA